MVADLVKTYGLMSVPTPVTAMQRRVDTAADAASKAMVGLKEVEAQVRVLDQLEADGGGTLPTSYEAKRQELRASLEQPPAAPPVLQR